MNLRADHGDRAVWSQSAAGVRGSNLAEGMDIRLLRLLCCQVAASATSWSLVQGTPSGCVIVCDLQT
jgi:hypothetical protein